MLAEDGTFWPILMGQSIMSLGYPIFNAAISLICNKWFPDKERTLVTAICGLAIPSGNIFAFTMSGLIFQGLKLPQPIDTPDPVLVAQIKAAELRLLKI